MDGIRRFGLHPQEETLPDEQVMVDVTSLRDTVIALSGNQKGYQDEITGDIPGYVDKRNSI